MRTSLKLMLAQLGLTLLTYALPVFLASGLRLWPSAWIFLASWFGFWLSILVWLYRQNPALFQERMQLRSSGQKGVDKLLGPLVNVSLFCWLLFTSFDAGRFHWSPVTVWLQVLGLFVLLGAFFLYFLTFRDNAFLSPLVRVQEERGQRVISSGPYRFVRNPMYAATLAVIPGASLLLGAWYGILAGLLVAFVLACRAVLEERALQKELPGYADYRRQVKYRLIPYVW